MIRCPKQKKLTLANIQNGSRWQTISASKHALFPINPEAAVVNQPDCAIARQMIALPQALWVTLHSFQDSIL
jgi:hypothetical protein